MSKTILCDYNDAYILAKGTYQLQQMQLESQIITIKKIEDFASFTDCISKTNTTQVDNVEDIGKVLWMYNLIEYSDKCRKHPEVYGNIKEMDQL